VERIKHQKSQARRGRAGDNVGPEIMLGLEFNLSLTYILSINAQSLHTEDVIDALTSKENNSSFYY
jgi:hypothetical protein